MATDFSLYLISDRHQVHPDHTLYSAIDAALQGGVKAVQLREKDLTTAELLTLAQSLRQLTRQYHAKLFINDRIDIALAVDADGIHLTETSVSVLEARQQLGDNKLIAASTHSLERALQAEAQGADFITFSPIFFTKSKAQYGAPQGLDKLRTICEKISIPVFALGGITPQQLQSVAQAGAAGVALISAILAASNPAEAAQHFYHPER
ncbi:MAG: thiamine-phosphate diphosphorylase [Desulfobacteraceae bacterium 4572_35.2]|nr:MAG: thiamine-phosphate diphosphorylase [Desulfobacteraceae bacterium 4572_35.2]